MAKGTAAPTYMTKEEVAAILNVTTRTVDRMVAQGRLTPKRSLVGQGRGGRRIFFDRSEVERLNAGIIRQGEESSRT